MEEITFKSQKDFIEKFQILLAEIEKDPIENFVKHPWFCNFEPTPAQMVALKLAFNKELDTIIPHDIWRETVNEAEEFDLELVKMTEVDLFEFMTGKDYSLYKDSDDVFNMIDFIIGRRGGKCLKSLEKIHLEDGSFVKVGDFVNKEIRLKAWDEASKDYVSAKANVIDNGVKDIYKIRTKYGYEFERTGNHPFLTAEGWACVDNENEPDYKKLKEKMRIGVPTNNPYEGSTPQDIKLVKLLAYFLADGYLVSEGSHYTLCNTEQKTEILSLIEGNYKIRPHNVSKIAEDMRVSTHSNIQKLLDQLNLLGTHSDTKFIPNWVYRLPNNQLSIFLNRLISTDGWACVSKEGKKLRPQIGFSSASKDMSLSVKRLLARFGIISNIHKAKSGYKIGGVKKECKDRYSVIIQNGSEISKFLDRIGLFGKDDEIAAINAALNDKNSFNTQIDSMPLDFCIRFSKKLKKLLSYTVQERDYFGRIRPDRCARKDRLIKYAEMFPEHFREELSLLKSDLYWDEIVSIEYSGKHHTVGIEVPKYHTYINDVVEHNTTLSAILAIYRSIVTNWKPFLRKTPFATVLILSHSREFSDEVLEIIRTFIEESPILQNVINKKKKNTASTMNLSVPHTLPNGRVNDSRVQIKVGAASSKTTRGTAACTVLTDEIAFWNLDENLKESDAKILKAVRPAMKQFGEKGLLIKLSSPGIKQGILYEEYLRWREGTLPENYLVLKAPSWVWNNIINKREYFIEWKLDQEGFDTEYRANFVDAISNFIIPEFVDMAILQSTLFNPPEDKKANVKYYASVDAAFKGDTFTFSVMGHFENRIKQYIMKGWRGTKKEPVKAIELAKYISAICKEYDVQEVEADQYAFQPLKEIFEQFGITLKERVYSQTYKKQIYFNIKRLIHSQQIDLLDHPKAPKELKELVVEQTAGGHVKIGHPIGGSDDYADAIAMSAFAAIEGAGSLGFSFNDTNIIKNYDLNTDINGNYFKAPPPEALQEEFGHLVLDNADLFMKHPETGKIVPIQEVIEEELDEELNEPEFLI